MDIDILSSLWMEGTLPRLTCFLERFSCFLSRLSFLDVFDDDGVAMSSGQTVVKLSLNDEAVDGVPVFDENPVCWTGWFYIPYGWKVYLAKHFCASPSSLKPSKCF